ncbi:unnamed protein product [Sphenostylis stenocarpa]|uniref:Uncharacterized protein n=1 Tax=Sphenostylis stenocarpa TaxID=92480 RepID=A0AA86V7D2_9FABA|nr:unnamed protein product [Sphenostylis stenocarpa]
MEPNHILSLWTTTTDPEHVKVIQWEDFQHDLARLASLSCAVDEAKEKKRNLHDQLLSLIQGKRVRYPGESELDWGMKYYFGFDLEIIGEMKERDEKVVLNSSQLAKPWHSGGVYGLLIIAECWHTIFRSIRCSHKGGWSLGPELSNAFPTNHQSVSVELWQTVLWSLLCSHPLGLFCSSQRGLLDIFELVNAESLHRLNELEELRQKLESKKMKMENLSIRCRLAKEDASKQEERLSGAVQSLLVAGGTLSVSSRNLQLGGYTWIELFHICMIVVDILSEMYGIALKSLVVYETLILLFAHVYVSDVYPILESSRSLSEENGYVHLKKLQKMLRRRQQHMTSQISVLYPVKITVGPAQEQELEAYPMGTLAETASPPLPPCTTPPNVPLPDVPAVAFVFLHPSQGIAKGTAAGLRPVNQGSLTIHGLHLDVLSFRKMSFFPDKKEIQGSSTALGYVAHAVSLIASYLQVPLRYPLRLCGSHSYIVDNAPSTELTSEASSNKNINAKHVEFPLFLEGQDTTRSAYAVFLLNKYSIAFLGLCSNLYMLVDSEIILTMRIKPTDLEQLLNFIDAKSLGPRHVLANLRELLKIIQSPAFIDNLT